MPRSLRLAMWSGPRNISTALMRSWGSRPDAAVCDEPLYAHYLTQIDATRHPGHRETLAAHESDWRKIADFLTGPIPDGKPVFYQKHMAHHLLPHIDVAWIDRLANCFLIRHPRRMLASLVEFIEQPTVGDTGLPQQVALYDRLVEHGATPPVIDAEDVLADPARLLRRLCDAVEVDYDPRMLAWAPGPRSTDGAWGPYWYAKVYRTTGFSAADAAPPPPLPERLQPLIAECKPLYAHLHERRLSV